LREQRHDYLNHFQVIYGLMELKDYEEAKKYLDPVFKDIMKVSKALKTAQPAVNALLQAKLEVAEKRDIDLFLEVRSDLKNLSIEPWNLCKVLANVIDNSITAVSMVEKERSIYLEIGEDNSSYTFRIYNNGPMIPGNHLEEIFKQGFTTKKEQGHGMGLYIVSKMVREVGGSIKVTSNKEKTCFDIEIPKTSLIL
jgi:sensor histidine kinase regulating citrate/malate metabolism